MITCPKCGTDNLLNAIFCRGCGDKLDLNELKPDSFIEKKLTKSQKIMKVVNQVLGVIIALLLVALIGGLFSPVAHNTGNSPSAEAAAAFNEARDFGDRPTGRRRPRRTEENKASSKEFSFSSVDSTALVNKALKLPDTNAGDNKLVSENLSVSYGGDGSVTLVFTCKLLGKLPMHNVLLAKPSISNGAFAMNVQQVKVGFVPIPAQLNDKVIQKFLNVYGNNSDLEKIRKKLSALSVTEGTLKITVGGK
jgi:hypothetical protein